MAKVWPRLCISFFLHLFFSLQESILETMLIVQVSVPPKTDTHFCTWSLGRGSSTAVSLFLPLSVSPSFPFLPLPFRFPFPFPFCFLFSSPFRFVSFPLPFPFPFPFLLSFVHQSFCLLICSFYWPHLFLHVFFGLQKYSHSCGYYSSALFFLLCLFCFVVFVICLFVQCLFISLFPFFDLFFCCLFTSFFLSPSLETRYFCSPRTFL